MDPYTATRAEFTQGMLNNPMPPSSIEVAPQWRSLILDSKELFRLLGAHSAMRLNNQQTYMTPARTKSKVYFMWDFVGRTLNYAYRVPPDLKDLTAEEQQNWNDAITRSVLTASLLLDEMPGMLDQMVDRAYPGQTGELPFGQRPVISEEIKAVARRLNFNE